MSFGSELQALRRKHGINIIAVKVGEALLPSPGADYVFSKEDHVVVIGRSEDVFKVAGKKKR